MGATSQTIGFLYPGYSAEDDYPAYQELLGGTPELRVVHTLMREDAHRVDALLDVGGPDVLAEGARQLTGAAAVIWACTSGSFVFGWQGAKEQVTGVADASKAPASSTSFAFVNAARHLGVRRVAVAATYPEDVARHFRDFLATAGIEVLSLSSRGIVTAAEVGLLEQADVIDFIGENDHPEADAVLVPDTALHSAGLLSEAEKRLGKPILTANQVSVWEGMRLAGEPLQRDGLGQLFASEAPAATTAVLPD